MFSRFFLALLIVIGSSASPAAELVPAKQDWAQIRSVISGQIEAFRRGDGKAAFSYASPGIRETFKTPDHFIDMVRNTYPAVYRPASIAFLESSMVHGAPVQTVQISDSEGAVWIAVYTMQRQKDRSWKIHACQLLPAKAVAA